MTEQAKVPAIRFAGFTDPWEQRKFSDVAMIKRGLTYSPTDIVDGAGGIRVLRSSNINEDQFVLNNDDVFVNEGAVTIDLVHDGDILITAANGSPRLVGKRARISDLPGKTVQGGFMLVALSPCSDFLCASMGSSWYRRFLATGVAGGNGAIGNLDSKALGETTIAVPNDAEKDKIGCFFTRLDSLITLHQRKYDKLVVFKKTMLEKMFPKDGESVPEIRFAGFTDPWEQRKLGEVATRVTRKNEGESDLPLTISAQHGLVDQRTFFNNQVASKDMSGYYLLRKGEFAYNKSTSGDSPWGAVKRLVNYEKGCVSTLYICFGLDGTDPNYLVTYYETDCWHKGVQMIAAEGARNHGLLNIAPNDFFDTVLALPSSQEEQRRVGSLFARLDSLITLHQRKLELLQNIKKSLLDKMFV
ncbi:restriction endonuclease subunit S [Bifidobacterium bifidum]|uniref:restriction endonuclease subunit S n=1 Tax=Bifidobacterium bifidum TaxID=1681 RepID=UPI003F6AA358